MKSPSEIARELFSEAWVDDFGISEAQAEHYRQEIANAITKERQRQERLIELVDGCTPVIESWAVISVAQAEWKKRWLSEAQQVLREVKGA